MFKVQSSDSGVDVLGRLQDWWKSCKLGRYYTFVAIKNGV